jgi:nucleotide-binding universal stress UspA family protein
MKESMKILIGYDGSECADAALADLKRAGLPREVDAMLVSVAEAWMPPPPPSSYEIVEVAKDLHSAAELQKRYAKSSQAMKEANELAVKAGEKLRDAFPCWNVQAEALLGSPAHEIIMRADEWKPNLIIVGSHGRSAFGRFVLGSISQKILSEARCSVRIARGKDAPDDSPARIIIGLDDSEDSKLALSEAASRQWPTGSVVELVTAVEPFYAYGIEPVKEIERARRIQKEAAVQLRQASLRVSMLIEEGNPQSLLVKEAKRFEADTIFIGAKGHSLLERFLLGSVSAAVAARAYCSVEVARQAKV